MAEPERKLTEGPAARLGGELRLAREKLGFELPALASSLRIRLSYLEAIENGRLADLPGTTYALGFVRTYAAALGLPGDDIAKRFRAEAEAAHKRPKLSFPAPVPQGGVPAGAVMLLGAIILAVAYGGWYWVSEHHATPVQTVPPIPDRLAESQTAKLPPSPQVASILPATAPPAPVARIIAPPVVASVVTPTIAPPAVPPVLATVPLAAASLPPAAAAVPVLAPAPTSTPVPTAPSAGDAVPLGTRVVLKFSADTWVTIKLKGAPALLIKLMHAGDSYSVPGGKTGVALTTGNAGGVSVEVDGKALPPIGGSGAVRRDLSLDPDYLVSLQWQQPAKPKAKPALPLVPPVLPEAAPN